MRQADLAAACGLSRETISALERGATAPYRKTLEAVAQVLDWDVAELAEGQVSRARKGSRSRIRTRFDVRRMAEAVKSPGIDPRTWTTTGRVDDDEDAIRWDAKLGWLIDVTFTGGDLDQEGPVVCRVASHVASQGNGRIEPVERDCEVIVVVTEGDPNSNPVIIGQIFNGGGCEAPTQVNDKTIDEALALVTQIVRSAYAVEEEYDGDRNVTSNENQHLKAVLAMLLEGITSATVKSGGPIGLVTSGLIGTPDGTISLGGTETVKPTEQVIKGTEYVAAEAVFLTALNVWTAAVAVLLPALVPAQATLAAATAVFAVQAQLALSRRTKTE